MSISGTYAFAVICFFARVGGADLHPWVAGTKELRSVHGRAKLDGLMPECIRKNAMSQHWEDRMVFLPLRCMRDGQPGTFVELGAYTGIRLSNTLMLERCFDWTGYLERSEGIQRDQETKSKTVTNLTTPRSSFRQLRLFLHDSVE